ncbi:protein translocase subunit secF [Ferrimonas balearica DSM 9799]|uniref:Protein-export membrane protein SecF n=1 Tax=Ferrimonas balearica (strain DSM 9799 / CCM 4581 / KCTC 23876 / PAT) TaxID=550540 RepID=E1SRQ5_FERBD|nr:protein translocase subunit SecF [Ferrimonas balearica]MBY6017472.1 protein translocase subunit SecF [Halomonas denitrificans]ADN76976.1 protein translocase subunit secF [Ferrimonas balearica DSM 9799]MBW3140029.1 protein translocase subunit SecF [Ferrimonas balearica]MBW3165053.1 protein translocase subunit SecF [Ferrimonas balearica]MBY6093738.1 protein translocase subunit SecF [Ferrimonas balearica]
MFELLKVKGTIDFLKHAKVVSLLSIVLVVASLVSLGVRGINWGLDFTGGYVIEVNYGKAVSPADLRRAVEGQDIEGAVVQQFGSARDLIVRIPPKAGEGNELVTKVEAAAKGLGNGAEIKRVEFVGPQVGKELAEQGGLAVLVALICILAYVAARFEWRLALGAVIALAHDVIVTLGVFSLLQMEFDLTVLAALLAVVGYSLNDTIVVFDRVRENFRKMRKGSPEHVVNTSVTQTMSRTIITTGTTLAVVVALFLLGGTMIHGFATALLLGIGVGTYSSIYVASYASIRLGLTREHMLPVQVEKEGADQDPLIP